MRKSNRWVGLLGATGFVIGGLFLTPSASAQDPVVPVQARKADRSMVGFMLVSYMNNRCLEVRDGNTGNGAMLDMWDCHGLPAERFSWDNGQIRSDLTGKCLDIVVSNHENGAGVNMFDCRGWPAQQWHWDRTRLVSSMSGRCLEISGANPHPGASVQMWDCDNGRNQDWRTS
ncbi:RICIN domain-containing protein [Streptomyces netropsis]|uniref:RICIN domain-containing protein n=1 Tax=Streptomyces netropsis TaxID=55404 RepID=UPI0037B7DE2E